MIIQNIFRDDINRKINGVVKVDQSADDVLVQELEEYVITKELKKHFITFFTNYADSFNGDTADMGVWISGFFGSGKSHFLKMLSYILANKEVQGVKTVERFRKKFEGDTASFSLLEKATASQTDTILFNIDIEGSINKDKTAVLRVFAKMFYNYLGFYGENLKVAKLEQHIDKMGKTEEFRRVFEENNGQTWLEARDSYDFFEDDVVAALTEVLGMSEDAAHNWFNGSEQVETSIAQLVKEIKDYVDSKPADFRLLFMIDEVGQYIGDSTDLLMNLQSLVEKIGSECNGKVWVVCTGQEAIDEIIKTRMNEFSRIQARFKTRMSLSSSSADEVIQKRILRKKAEFVPELEKVFSSNESVMRNLFSFNDCKLDIKGFESPSDFVKNFPFVPYQFIILQKVFAEIRKHGNSGKHLSGGERSMLSGFQEAAQKIQNLDEYALAPFHLFYDTVHTFLDSTIRRVIERCQKAADMGAGIKPQDVDVLKLLYLVRYIDDIKANIENLAILMAKDLRANKADIRNEVRGSLDRLLSQNYIGRTGDVYNFLTDEEQDIQREIRDTVVDAAAVSKRISNLIFEDIYPTKKFKYEKYDFGFDKMVDGAYDGIVNGEMTLSVLTIATGEDEKNELRLLTDSVGKAVVVLGDTTYYEALEQAMKVRKYVKMRNVPQLPRSQQDIIRAQLDEATKLENQGREALIKAIESAKFYIDGEVCTLKPSDAKGKLNQALERLVLTVYKDLTLIDKNFENDSEIMLVAKGQMQADLSGRYPNSDAAAKIDDHLEVQYRKNIGTTVADIQSRYQSKPYGWREIDIAAVIALLIFEQKVTVKYGGSTIVATDPKLPDYLRKKSMIGSVSIAKRQVVSVAKIKEVIEFLNDYFGKMSIPKDEDGLVAFIKTKFTEQKEHYANLKKKYQIGKYPDELKVNFAYTEVDKVLQQSKDNIALMNYIIQKQDSILESKEALEDVETFFKNQIAVFDDTVAFVKSMNDEVEYLNSNDEATQCLNQLRKITLIPLNKPYNYNDIPKANGLMDKVKAYHTELLDAKRKELNDFVLQCEGEVKAKVEGKEDKLKKIIEDAGFYFDHQKHLIQTYSKLSLMDGMQMRIMQKVDNLDAQIKMALVPVEPVKPKPPVVDPKKPEVKPVVKKKIVKSYSRQLVSTVASIETQADIDAYVENIRKRLMALKKDCDVLELK